MRRIGIMGGTFDPIHNGHLGLGHQALIEYSLDKIWYMPAKNPPHKKERKVVDVLHRAKMVELAVQDIPGFRYSDFELLRSGSSFTAQTIMLLKEMYKTDQFFWIVGADSLFEIETWYHSELILSTVTLLVAPREYDKLSLTLEEQIKYLQNKYQANVNLLHCKPVNISSSVIRKQVLLGNAISSFVPEAVENYIKHHQLYNGGIKYE